MNSKRTRIALVGCTLAAVTAGGCRSSMPGLNMFGWNREPSAETLAGTGPTTTYPVPPSVNAKPQAIDSIAADVTGPKASKPGPAAGTKGTSPSAAQVAGMNFGGGDIDMGASSGMGSSATAAATQKSSAANLAAAQANGFNPGGVATPASATGTSPATKPAGIAPSYEMPSMESMASKPASAPSTTSSIAPPAGTSMPSSKPSESSVGYTLPPGLDPGSSKAGSSSESEPNDKPMSAPDMETKVAGSEPKAAGEADAKVASRPDQDGGLQAGGVGGSSDGSYSGVKPSGFTAPSGSYAPGSTSGESAYPSSPSPSGGSIFR